MDEKQYAIRHQSAPCQHLGREEVGTGQNAHVRTDEILPRCGLHTFGCGRNAPPLRNIADLLVLDRVHQIAGGANNSIIAPTAIVPGEFDCQILDFS